jgi:LysM repeat protein
MRFGRPVARWLLLAVLLTASPLAARPARCTVRRGDTLSSIAKRYDVTIRDLRRWNHLRKDRIRPGDRLHLRPATRMYTVRRGDTLAKIAKREGASVDDILDLNPNLDAKSLRAGTEIEVPGGEVNGPAKPSKETKKGRRKGRKAGGGDCPTRIERVPAHVGYRRAHSDAGWATKKTNRLLKRGFDVVLRRHRLAPRVEVLDASRKDLGPVGDHRSHQEGRDVDISYYQKICPRRGCPAKTVKPSLLDARRQWTLFRYWLKRDEVEMIFVDHALAAELYDYAKRHGATKKQLDEWFQYPSKPGTHEGIIRHWPGHKDHLHVRFHAAKAGKCSKR